MEMEVTVMRDFWKAGVQSTKKGTYLKKVWSWNTVFQILIRKKYCGRFPDLVTLKSKEPHRLL